MLLSSSSLWSRKAFLSAARASASLCLLPRRFWSLSNSTPRWSAAALQDVLCSAPPLLRWYWALVRRPSRLMAADSSVFTFRRASFRSLSNKSDCCLSILWVASTACLRCWTLWDREAWLCRNWASWHKARCRLSTTWLASANSCKQSSALPWRRWRSSARPRAPSFARWPCRLCSSAFLLSTSAAWSWKSRESYWFPTCSMLNPHRYRFVMSRHILNGIVLKSQLRWIL